jgi:hypothetical protein
MDENFEFVKRCIESCINIWQLQVAYRMIDLFIEYYGDCGKGEILLDIILDKQAIID